MSALQSDPYTTVINLTLPLSTVASHPHIGFRRTYSVVADFFMGIMPPKIVLCETGSGWYVAVGSGGYWMERRMKNVHGSQSACTHTILLVDQPNPRHVGKHNALHLLSNLHTRYTIRVSVLSVWPGYF